MLQRVGRVLKWPSFLRNLGAGRWQALNLAARIAGRTGSLILPFVVSLVDLTRGQEALSYIRKNSQIRVFSLLVSPSCFLFLGCFASHTLNLARELPSLCSLSTQSWSCLRVI